jgi:hypothetical protein
VPEPITGNLKFSAEINMGLVALGTVVFGEVSVVDAHDESAKRAVVASETANRDFALELVNIASPIY